MNGWNWNEGDTMSKEYVLRLLNHALELEHAAYVQYLSHAEIVDGENAEPIIERLKEIAGDEKNHQEKFRVLIEALDGVPSMGIAPTHTAKITKEILEQNLEDEKEAVDMYRGIIQKLKTEKIQYYDYLLEHEVRHILMEEQEHITELEFLLAIQGSSY
jgi:bacterioferritin (cytochrome b1)